MTHVATGDRIQIDLSPDCPVQVRVEGMVLPDVTGIRIQQYGNQDPAIFLSFLPIRHPHDGSVQSQELIEQHFRYAPGTVLGRLVREEEWAIYQGWREEHIRKMQNGSMEERRVADG